MVLYPEYGGIYITEDEMTGVSAQNDVEFYMEGLTDEEFSEKFELHLEALRLNRKAHFNLSTGFSESLISSIISLILDNGFRLKRVVGDSFSFTVEVY